MTLKYFTGPITKADAGSLSAIISTPTVDKDGESVDPRGLSNRAEWLTNPLIFWAHEWAYNPLAEPVGKGTRLDIFRDRIEGDGEWAPTDKAQNVRALVLGGFVRKTSIGFDPIEMEAVKGVPTHTRWALREWSVVPMPANTEATITGVKSALRWLADEVAEPTDGAIEDGTITVRLDPTDLLRALDNLRIVTLDDGALALTDRGRRVAVIRRRRVAVLT